MKTPFTIALATVAVLALAGPGWSQTADPDNLLKQKDLVANGEGVVQDNANQLGSTTADHFGASASDDAFAYVDNSIRQKDSTLTRNDLEATVSHSAVQMDGDFFDAKNEIDHSFIDFRGIAQTGQNNGQNSIVQQSFTIQSNVPIDKSPSP